MTRTTDRLAEVLDCPSEAEQRFCAEVWSALKDDHVDLRKEAIILRAYRLATQSLSTDLDKAQQRIAELEAENARLRKALAAKPWPPTDAELREMLAAIVGAWWSPSTAQTIRTARQLKPEDVKGLYAVRDALAPYVARAALNQPKESGK